MKSAIIPGHPNFTIFENGVIINNVTNQELKNHITTTYLSVTIERKFYNVHRLLGLAFLPIPDDLMGVPLEKLVVNHKDGDKLNNAIANLEWVTYSENMVHAFKAGLRLDNNVVLVKDLRDEKVTRFYSQARCAEFFGVDPASIHYYLESSKPGRIFKGYYLIIHDGDEWPEYDRSKVGEGEWGGSKPVILTYKNGNQIIFKAISACARHLNNGKSVSTIMFHLREKGFYENKTKDYKIEFYRDFITANKDGEGELKRRVFTTPVKPPIPIRVTNLESGEITEWGSTQEFADCLGVLKNTIQKSMLINDGRYNVFHIEYLKDV